LDPSFDVDVTLTFLAQDLQEALQHEGCPLCVQMDRTTRKSLLHFLREGKNHDHVYEHLIRSFGLCHRHAWTLYEIELGGCGDGLSTATLYDWLLDYPLRSLAWDPVQENGRRSFLTRKRRSWRAKRFSDQLTQQASCPACVHLGKYELAAARGLSKLLSADAMNQALVEWYRKSSGLCLPHFRMVVRETEDPIALETLIEV